MSYEYEIEDLEYDTGYGVQVGNLYVECEAILEDGSFDAYNSAGNLQSYGGYEVTGVKVVHANLLLLGNNGVELGEVDFDNSKELFEVYPHLEEELIERLSEEQD